MSLSRPAGAPVLRAAAMRAAEEAVFAAGTSAIDLMERAGMAVAREARRFAMGAPVLVLAGPGNNGGDAYVVARLLAEWGVDVMVAASAAPRSEAASAMRERWTGEVVALAEAEPRPFVIDGLFGTGLARPLDRSIAEPLRALVAAARFALAIDLPSGLASDSGADLGAVRMTATVALGALKPAHLLSPGRERCGHVLLADLYIPVSMEWRTIARPHIAAPASDAHKYRRGMLGVIAGEMPGAAALAARAAVRGGAGYIVLAGGNCRDDAVVQRPAIDRATMRQWLEDRRLSALLLGPGLGRGDAARELVAMAIASDVPLVLDGDALALCSPDRLAARHAETVLTPHSGEFATLFGDVGGDKIEATLAAAAATRATIIHKGPDTVIAAPDGQVVIAADATSWLSTAGTGDVLAGLVASRLAAAPDCVMAAAEAAVWVHGRAASRCGPAFAADDLIGQLGGAIAECR